MSAGKELSLARKQSNLTLRKLAAFADTSSAAISQIETGKRGVSFERLQSLLNLSGYRLVSISTNAKTPVELAELIKGALTSDDSLRALRAFVAYSKTLKLLDPGVRVALTLNRPESAGDSVYDAAIASLVQHWLSIDSLPIPNWVYEPSLTLPTPTILGGSFLDSVPSKDQVPIGFAEHNVLFPAEALEDIGFLL